MSTDKIETVILDWPVLAVALWKNMAARLVRIPANDSLHGTFTLEFRFLPEEMMRRAGWKKDGNGKWYSDSLLTNDQRDADREWVMANYLAGWSVSEHRLLIRELDYELDMTAMYHLIEAATAAIKKEDYSIEETEFPDSVWMPEPDAIDRHGNCTYYIKPAGNRIRVSVFLTPEQGTCDMEDVLQAFMAAMDRERILFAISEASGALIDAYLQAAPNS